MIKANLTGIFLATTLWRMIVNTLALVGLNVVIATAWAALVPPTARAFDAAAVQTGESPKVIVFDNAYLDRRFGPTRLAEANKTAGQPGNVRAFGALVDGGSLEIAPNRSLLKGITRGTPPRRAAALRLAESGRKAVHDRQYRKAIHYLEKALSLDGSPFFHFYLARAHYQSADYQRAAEFLKVAESAFAGHDGWLAEVSALRRALAAAPGASDAGREALKSNVAWTERKMGH